MEASKSLSLLRALVFGGVALAAASAAFQAHAVGTLADVRIFDRKQGKELPVYWHEGRAYVAGTPGNEYEVVVRNRVRGDVLAVVSVDGVNAVTGQTASFSQGGYVLGPRERTRIRGWRKSLDETAAFYFTSLGDSYAGRTGRPDNVGVIGVALFERAVRHDEPRARADALPYEPSPGRAEAQPQAAPGAKSHRAPAPAPQLGTGHGRREDSPARRAEFERATDHPAEVLTIHYDSYRNLVAQGVIPRYGRRAPEPFPGGFVPDPPRGRW